MTRANRGGRFNVYGAEPMKTGLAKVNGTELYYEVRGKGPPVVLISGGGILDKRCWDDQFETFSKKYQVIRYDIRGIGKSGRPREAFSHSHDLYALLKFLKIARAHVVGLSVGGAIAIDFALDHPEMVDKLVLAASGTSSDATSEANLQSVLALSALVKKKGMPRVIQLTLDAPSVISKENSAAREKISQIYMDNRDVFEADFPLFILWQPTTPQAAGRLAEIRARTLVIQGDNDSPAYKAITDRLGAGISGAKKVVIAGGTHFINLEKPEEFNRAVLEFLNDR
jgi:3-oxoadipate enol-lactonase